MLDAPPEELSLSVRGATIAAKAWGPQDSRPVLALHGWLDNAASFDRLAPLLPSCRTVGVDLPGHGLSDRRAGNTPYHFTDWVTDVTAIVDSLGWERFAIIGHSAGAAIGCLFAGTFPERVERLVLLDGLGPLTLEPDRAPERLARGIRRHLSRAAGDPRVFADWREAADRMRAANLELSEAAAEALMARSLEQIEGGWRWRSDPRLRVPSLIRLTDAHVKAFLSRIACPTLVVRASRGWPVDEDWASNQVAAIGNATSVVLDGGHHFHLDHPDLVAEVVGPFLGK